MKPRAMQSCPLCNAHNETILFQNEQLRVILVTDQPLVPTYCRVIWHQHIVEMTDLLDSERQQLMDMVYQVEQAFKTILHPDKINLASFGTVVPHQHWHIIARFKEDAYYPNSIWSSPQHHNIPQLPENWIADLKNTLLPA